MNVMQITITNFKYDKITLEDNMQDTIKSLNKIIKLMIIPTVDCKKSYATIQVSTIVTNLTIQQGDKLKM